MLQRLLIVALAVLAPILAIFFFTVGGTDDGYITYHVADRLAETGRLANYNGNAVEQSTSLGHVLALAALRVVTGIGTPMLAYLLGLIGLSATVLLSGVISARLGARWPTLAAGATAIAFPISHWATGGLETVLVVASVLGFIVAANGWLMSTGSNFVALLRLGAAVLACVLIRPDTMLSVLAISCAPLFSLVVGRLVPGLGMRLPGFRMRPVLVLFGVSTATALVVTGFRWVVFGSLVPQPVWAKSTGRLEFAAGLRYLRNSLTSPVWWALLLLALVGGAILLRRLTSIGFLVITAFLVTTAAALGEGGDWMPGGRLLVLPVALMIVLASVGVSLIALPWRAIVALILGVGEILALVSFANSSAPGVALPFRWESTRPQMAEVVDAVSGRWLEGRNVKHLRDEVFLNRVRPVIRQAIMVRNATPDNPLTIAGGQAGYVIYHLKQEFSDDIRFIDTSSLTTNDFNGCPGLFHSTLGAFFTFESWRANQGRCAPRLPDLFLGLYFVPAAAPGYELLIDQQLDLRAGWKRRPSRATGVLAARQDLALSLYSSVG